MNHNYNLKTKGFIALITVIIITALISLLLILGNIQSIQARENTYLLEQRQTTKYLKEGCAQLLALFKNIQCN